MGNSGSRGKPPPVKPGQAAQDDAAGVEALEAELRRARELADAQQARLDLLAQDLELEQKLAEMDDDAFGEGGEEALAALNSHGGAGGQDDEDLQLDAEELEELEKELEELDQEQVEVATEPQQQTAPAAQEPLCSEEEEETQAEEAA